MQCSTQCKVRCGKEGKGKGREGKVSKVSSVSSVCHLSVGSNVSNLRLYCVQIYACLKDSECVVCCVGTVGNSIVCNIYIYIYI